MGNTPSDWKYKFSNWWWDWESRLEKAFILVASLLILTVFVSGCSTYAIPYTREPTLSTVCVTVNWVESHNIHKHCSKGATACATIGSDYQCSGIWTTKPAAFDDYDAVYRLGHELLHRLGATHK